MQPWRIITYEFPHDKIYQVVKILKSEGVNITDKFLRNIETTYVIQLLRVQDICTYIYITKKFT